LTHHGLVNCRKGHIEGNIFDNIIYTYLDSAEKIVAENTLARGLVKCIQSITYSVYFDFGYCNAFFPSLAVSLIFQISKSQFIFNLEISGHAKT